MSTYKDNLHGSSQRAPEWHIFQSVSSTGGCEHLSKWLVCLPEAIFHNSPPLIIFTWIAIDTGTKNPTLSQAYALD